MSFGKKLKYLRKANKLSQKELGEVFGLSDRTIGHYEAGERFPKSAQLLLEMAEYFGVSINELLDHQVPPSLPYIEFLEQAKVHFNLASEEQQIAMFQTLTMIYYESWKKKKTSNS